VVVIVTTRAGADRPGLDGASHPEGSGDPSRYVDPDDTAG
jgi:hypothetical protein